MGLDMYLNKVKRVNGANIKEISFINDYLRFINEDHKNSSFKEWSGIDESEVNKDLIKKYESEFITRYYAWDDEKKYGNKSIVEYLAYWRKANQIHTWFVNNVQDGNDDCDVYEVSKLELETLLDLCREVRISSVLVDGKIQNGYTFSNGKEEPIMEDGKYILDPSVAQELLPTSHGFFFGSTNYDQWYMNDIEYTIEVLEKILSSTDFDHEIVYYTSSW